MAESMEPGSRPGTRAPRAALTAAVLLAGLLLAPVPSCGRSAEDGSSAGRKVERVVLVVCDTLRADRLGTYGNARGLTPHLDAFAQDAVVFERTYSASSLTMPSMASFLSGRTVREIGIGRDNRWNLPEDVDTLAELVAAGGTRTAAVVSNTVLRAPDPEEAGTRGIAQGFDLFDDRLPSKEMNRHHRERVAADTTAAALEAVDGIVAEGMGDDFFLWVHYIDPHGPYTPPDPYRSYFDGGYPGGPELVVGQYNGGRREIPNYQSIDGATDAGLYRSRYDGEVAYFDQCFGDLMAGLEERDLLDGTLVVFTADHAEALGERGWWFVHGRTLDASMTHVPLIVRFPGAEERGRSDAAIGHLDVHSTILDAFGLRRRGDPRHTLFAGWEPRDRATIQQLGRADEERRSQAVQSGSWRLIVEDDALPRLFDVAADPLEEVDLAAQEPEVVAELLERYREECERLETDPIGPVPDATASPERERELRGLGYGR